MFQQQSQAIIAQNTFKQNQSFHKNTTKDFINKDYKSLAADTQTSFFNDLADSAYKSKDGFAIKRNPSTNKNELFVAGTRTTKDWLANGYEAGLKAANLPTKYFAPYRNKFANKLDKAIKQQKVDIAYGHSRGGALLGDTNSNIKKVGLDSAQLLNNNKNMLNIRQANKFDWAISLTGKNNKVIGPKKRLWNRKYHYIYKY